MKEKIDEIKMLEDKLAHEKLQSDEMSRCLSKYVIEN
jgi:hypothetical protein